MDMGSRQPTRHRARHNPVSEIECAELHTVAHHTLHALELTVVDPEGRGFRTWIGADVAPHAALRFCAATVRLIGGDPT
jgi:hypothetical protein